MGPLEVEAPDESSAAAEEAAAVKEETGWRKIGDEIRERCLIDTWVKPEEWMIKKKERFG